jgi:hypothetical protein
MSLTAARGPPAADLVREGVLDVAGRQSARIEFDSQALEHLRATTKILRDRRHERLGRVTRLRRRELDHSFGRLHPTRSVSIPIALRFAIGPLVALAADLVANFALQGFPRISRAGNSTSLDRSGTVPNGLQSRHEASRVSARVRIFYLLGCSLGANGANRKPALLLRFRQGASQPLFPASLMPSSVVPIQPCSTKVMDCHGCATDDS